MRIICLAYSILFETIASVLLIGIACLAMIGNVNDFRLPLLPWEGATLAHAVLALGIIGLVVVLLAVTRWFRTTLPVWAFVLLVLFIHGWFASSYTFAGPATFRTALWITVGALLAFACSFAIFARPARKL